MSAHGRSLKECDSFPACLIDEDNASPTPDSEPSQPSAMHLQSTISACHEKRKKDKVIAGGNVQPRAQVQCEVCVWEPASGFMV